MRPVALAVLAGLVACAPDPDLPPSKPGNESGGTSPHASESGDVDDGGTSSGGSTDSTDGTGDTTTGGLPDGFNWMFVTAQTFVPGELGGLAAADGVCQQAATDAGLGGTYVAWLSDATTDAKNRLAGARNWWRVDMLPFADQVNDVINARILYPPRIDEHGVDHPAATVLTATGADGVKVIDDDLGTCADWSEIGGGSATGGISDAGDELWTDWRALPVDCDTAQHLYCFGVDNDAPMELTPAVGRAAFVSRDVFLPQLGLDTADAQCQQEAVQAGLQGQFLALLATTMVGAADRFDLQGEPWVRADGVGVVAQAVQLGTGTLLAPLVLDAEGLPVASSPVWTGATGVAMVSEDESCLDWSDLGSIGRIGMSSRSAPGWFDSGTTTCDQENGRLYCLEQ